MKLFKSIFAISALCVAVAACESNPKFKEDMLSSAGFKPTPPSTPAQQASLKNLPPHKLVQITRKGKAVWVYSDPTICGCLYVGNQAAYGSYREKVFVKQIADEQAMTADTYRMDWGPWGPGWY